MYDIIKEKIDAPEIKKKVQVTQRVRETRSSELLKINNHRSNYGLHEPINSMCNLFNKIQNIYLSSTNRNNFIKKSNA